MIYCINQPLEDYNCFVDGVEMGLYRSYRDRPALLAAVMLMTTAPFEYEVGSTIPCKDRIGSIDPAFEGYLADTLITCVGGKMIIGVLEVLDPYAFYEYLIGFDLSHLPIRKFYDTDQQLLQIIGARVGVWSEDCGFVGPLVDLAKDIQRQVNESKQRGYK